MLDYILLLAVFAGLVRASWAWGFVDGFEAGFPEGVESLRRQLMERCKQTLEDIPLTAAHSETLIEIGKEKHEQACTET